MRVSTTAMLPNFQHDVKGKLPFVVLNRKHSTARNADEPNERDSTDDTVFDILNDDVNDSNKWFVHLLITFITMNINNLGSKTKTIKS